ncbi:MAG: histidine kinase [Lachnospiraceae bacterium]|nr:histidine kinase [Lachnospiraceae bacterium]
MNKKKLKVLNSIVLIACAVAALCIFLFTFVFSPAKSDKISSDPPAKFNTNWILRDFEGENDQMITLPAKLKAKAGDIIVIMHVAPEGLDENSVLSFKTMFQNVIVTVGEERVYEYGVLNDNKLIKTAVPKTHLVPIGKAEPGDVIAIYLSSGYNKYSGMIPEISLSTRGDVAASIVKSNGVGFVIALTLLIISLILSIALVIDRRAEIDKKRSGYAFAFVLVTSLWSLLSNPIMELITGNVFGVYMSSMVLLLLMPILYLMHLRCFAVKKRLAGILDVGIYIFAVFMLTGIIFQMLYVMDFASFLTVAKVFITVGLIALSFIMYMAADVYADKTIVSSLFANLVLTVACLLEALLSMFSFYSSYDGVVLTAGLFVFMAMIMISTEKDMAAEVTKERDYAIENVEQEKSHAIRKLNTRFIFSTMNTAMNSVKVFSESDGRLIYDTSVYMKYNMKTANERSMVPFAEELKYIKSYLGMQERNHPGLVCNVEDKIIDFNVPFNTIEPLVENAVVNGALSGEVPGKIVVRSYERLDCYVVQIVDNGNGFGPDRRFTGKESYKDIKRTLKKMCGAIIEVKNKQDKGTIVSVMIPKAGFEMKEQ